MSWQWMNYDVWENYPPNINAQLVELHRLNSKGSMMVSVNHNIYVVDLDLLQHIKVSNPSIRCNIRFNNSIFAAFHITEHVFQPTKVMIPMARPSTTLLSKPPVGLTEEFQPRVMIPRVHPQRVRSDGAKDRDRRRVASRKRRSKYDIRPEDKNSALALDLLSSEAVKRPYQPPSPEQDRPHQYGPTDVIIDSDVHGRVPIIAEASRSPSQISRQYDEEQDKERQDVEYDESEAHRPVSYSDDQTITEAVLQLVPEDDQASTQQHSDQRPHPYTPRGYSFFHHPHYPLAHHPLPQHLPYSSPIEQHLPYPLRYLPQHKEYYSEPSGLYQSQVTAQYYQSNTQSQQHNILHNNYYPGPLITHPPTYSEQYPYPTHPR